ncbi:hypothetical protein PCE1_004555 [Barthelona sp. PCE]
MDRIRVTASNVFDVTIAVDDEEYIRMEPASNCFVCALCDNSCFRDRGIKKVRWHMLDQHLKSPKNDRVKSFLESLFDDELRCPKCPKSRFYSNAHLRNHNIKKHRVFATIIRLFKGDRFLDVSFFSYRNFMNLQHAVFYLIKKVDACSYCSYRTLTMLLHMCHDRPFTNVIRCGIGTCSATYQCQIAANNKSHIAYHDNVIHTQDHHSGFKPVAVPKLQCYTLDGYVNPQKVLENYEDYRLVWHICIFCFANGRPRTMTKRCNMSSEHRDDIKAFLDTISLPGTVPVHVNTIILSTGESFTTTRQANKRTKEVFNITEHAIGYDSAKKVNDFVIMQEMLEEIVFNEHIAVLGINYVLNRRILRVAYAAFFVNRQAIHVDAIGNLTDITKVINATDGLKAKIVEMRAGGNRGALDLLMTKGILEFAFTYLPDQFSRNEFDSLTVGEICIANTPLLLAFYPSTPLFTVKIDGQTLSNFSPVSCCKVGQDLGLNYLINPLEFAHTSVPISFGREMKDGEYVRIPFTTDIIEEFLHPLLCFTGVWSSPSAPEINDSDILECHGHVCPDNIYSELVNDAEEVAELREVYTGREGEYSFLEKDKQRRRYLKYHPEAKILDPAEIDSQPGDELLSISVDEYFEVGTEPAYVWDDDPWYCHYCKSHVCLPNDIRGCARCGYGFHVDCLVHSMNATRFKDYHIVYEKYLCYPCIKEMNSKEGLFSFEERAGYCRNKVESNCEGIEGDYFIIPKRTYDSVIIDGSPLEGEIPEAEESLYLLNAPSQALYHEGMERLGLFNGSEVDTIPKDTVVGTITGPLVAPERVGLGNNAYAFFIPEDYVEADATHVCDFSKVGGWITTQFSDSIGFYFGMGPNEPNVRYDYFYDVQTGSFFVLFSTERDISPGEELLIDFPHIHEKHIYQDDDTGREMVFYTNSVFPERASEWLYMYKFVLPVYYIKFWQAMGLRQHLILNGLHLEDGLPDPLAGILDVRTLDAAIYAMNGISDWGQLFSNQAMMKEEFGECTDESRADIIGHFEALKTYYERHNKEQIDNPMALFPFVRRIE